MYKKFFAPKIEELLGTKIPVERHRKPAAEHKVTPDQKTAKATKEGTTKLNEKRQATRRKMTRTKPKAQEEALKKSSKLH